MQGTGKDEKGAENSGSSYDLCGKTFCIFVLSNLEEKKAQ